MMNVLVYVIATVQYHFVIAVWSARATAFMGRRQSAVPITIMSTPRRFRPAADTIPVTPGAYSVRYSHRLRFMSGTYRFGTKVPIGRTGADKYSFRPKRETSRSRDHDQR